MIFNIRDVEGILYGDSSLCQKRKIYLSELHSRVALAIVHGDKTIHEIALRYGMLSQMVIRMKARFLDRIGGALSSRTDNEEEIRFRFGCVE